jgi:hypothetical protein
MISMTSDRHEQGFNQAELIFFFFFETNKHKMIDLYDFEPMKIGL